MDRKTFSIGILSLTAVILFIATLFPGKPAQAEFAVKDLTRLQLVSLASQKGGTILYVIDPNSGKIIVLTYDLQRKALVPIAGTTLDKAFNP